MVSHFAQKYFNIQKSKNQIKQFYEKDRKVFKIHEVFYYSENVFYRNP